MNNYTSEEKSGIGNIVTYTDKNLENYLLKSLSDLFPDSQIISEESSENSQINNKASLKFIIDPLDGTTNFTNGWPHSISIGIANNNQLVSGIIYDILSDIIYLGIKDYDTPYGSEAFKLTREMVTNLYLNGASLKTVGPISLDVLKTALGKENRPHDYNNAVWHTEVRAWDLAAATVILRELGGEVIGKDGKPLSRENEQNYQKWNKTKYKNS